MASLLLGYASGGSIDYRTASRSRTSLRASSFRTTIASPQAHVEPRLRWDYQTPVTERYDRTTRGFAYNTREPSAGSRAEAERRAAVCGRERPAARHLRAGLEELGAPHRSCLLPDIEDRHSRRLLAQLYRPLVGAVYPTGYSNTTSMVTTQDGINPKDLLRNPFPTGQLPPIGNSQGLGTLIGQNISFVDPCDRMPEFHNWHFDLQREHRRPLRRSPHRMSAAGPMTFGRADRLHHRHQREPQPVEPAISFDGHRAAADGAEPVLRHHQTGSLAGPTIPNRNCCVRFRNSQA